MLHFMLRTMLKLPKRRRILLVLVVFFAYYTIFHGIGGWFGESDDVHILSRNNDNGAEKKNLVYIKMIKCGSETLDAMFHRFALVRDLQCVLPVKNKLYLGWPYEIEKSFYRPSLASDGRFNVLSDHAVYSESLRSLMPKDTVYVTSIREPFSQFKSMFNYYNLKEVLSIETDDPLEDYFKNQEKYEALYKKPHPKKFCIPDGFSMSKNLMSFNLGFPTGFPEGKADYSDNRTAVKEWLRKITKRLDLVIIVEHFDESLVMLKRLMNWSLKDILYLRRNVGNYEYKENLELVRKYKTWSKVDYALYETFLSIFNERLKQGGDGLLDEITYYKAIRTDLQLFCASGQDDIKFDKSNWNEPFVVTKPFCDLLNQNLMDTLKAIYDQKNFYGEIQEPTKSYC